MENKTEPEIEFEKTLHRYQVIVTEHGEPFAYLQANDPEQILKELRAIFRNNFALRQDRPDLSDLDIEAGL